MAIKDWPNKERPREKLLASGAPSLSDAELLAIFLRTGVRGVSAVDLARLLLTEFGSLRALLEAEHDAFCQHHALGTAKFVQLQAVLEMGRRHLESALVRDDAFTDASATKRYLQRQLRHYSHEVFACLFLDTRHRLISFEPMFRGTIDGVSEPSRADIQIIRRLQSALELIDVRVLDHIIIGDTDTCSLAQTGEI